MEIGPGAGHGFGDGTGTSMDGWTDRASAWMQSIT
jgi:hypothetical protein